MTEHPSPVRGFLALSALTLAMSTGLIADAAPDVPDPADLEESAGLAEAVQDLEDDLDSLDEEVEDLEEPVEEFETFDQCMYLLGVTQRGSREADHGYVYGPGRPRHGPALAIDIRGLGTSQYHLLAFPGEEPPSIECNEDAAGQFTN